MSNEKYLPFMLISESIETISMEFCEYARRLPLLKRSDSFYPEIFFYNSI